MRLSLLMTSAVYLNALLLSLNWKFMARRSSTTSLLPKHSDHDSDKVWPKVRHNVERNSWPDFGQPLAIKVETSTHQVADDDTQGNEWNAIYLSYVQARNIVDKIESITSSTSGTME
ncbi:hypothetical protein PUNSTDRAFT_47472 [Punctularia strigosozonata HHB-11173 SS5]|uniref:Uncharacterized protein n=1 Tax=Punctularia strigosozonata (strain HHB-11173) TaxID=741275 RepID=R7S580_PUNST|nr:uncharacterized protein PUNSTDRAFT_47472 [Punctularia strigosozonata HHB-11173 SS5]EIN04501.1 hypothetical protein PUNSTDRAFT_47472 [Punctularia strigosozonata HHB-11173 SS5]